MTKKKKPEPNPIEEAIGERAKDLTAAEKFRQEYETEPLPTPETPSRILRDAPEQPITQDEMSSLEELNQKTTERYQDQYPEEPQTLMPPHKIPKVPVLQPDPPPVTKTSSRESPPQKTDTNSAEKPPTEFEHIDASPQEIDEIDEYQDAEKRPTMAESLGQKMNEAAKAPAEDVELVALRKYILEDGFVVATVAFHIVALCAQPMTTPSTTTWAFKDRAMIPEMVFALLNQPGYLEGIWPSLEVVMGSNKGNAAWTAGIATTIAFFDVIRTLPVIKELKNEAKKD